MARLLKILVFLPCIIAVSGKSVNVQFDFEDMLKLLPLLGNSKHLKEIVSSLSRSANVRAEFQKNGKYNNPYHPEDDFADYLGIDVADTSVSARKIDKPMNFTKETRAINSINTELIDGLKSTKKVETVLKDTIDINMEKDNDNFIKDKQSISDDELTDFVNDVNSISTSVQNITNASRQEDQPVVDIVDNYELTHNNTNTDDRSGFQFLQKRFILKSNDNGPTVKTTKESLQSQDDKSFTKIDVTNKYDNAPQNIEKVSTHTDEMMPPGWKWNIPQNTTSTRTL